MTSSHIEEGKRRGKKGKGREKKALEQRWGMGGEEVGTGPPIG